VSSKAQIRRAVSLASKRKHGELVPDGRVAAIQRDGLSGRGRGKEELVLKWYMSSG